MRIDANNLVTTASTTHLPEQKETIHMINMLRHEACSGAIEDLAHVATADMFADCQTKEKAPVDNLRDAVETGKLINCDKQPSFRKLMETKHKAYEAGPYGMLADWMVRNLSRNLVRDAETMLSYPVQTAISTTLCVVAKKGLGFTLWA